MKKWESKLLDELEKSLAVPPDDDDIAAVNELPDDWEVPAAKGGTVAVFLRRAKPKTPKSPKKDNKPPGKSVPNRRDKFVPASLGKRN